VGRLPDAGNLRFAVFIEIRRRATRCRNASFIENFTIPLCPVKAVDIDAVGLAWETGHKFVASVAFEIEGLDDVRVLRLSSITTRFQDWPLP
jgi:hypothetical protein